MNFLRNGNLPTQNPDHARSIQCIREMAAAIVLGRTGTEFDEGIIDGVCDNVASVAEEFDLSPEAVQAILEMHEPTLAMTAPEPLDD